jgi:glyoxylase-like metal-dependent hydrolase (beta-lactamase superfamily II)
MNKIKVLIEGYAKETQDGWVASSSTVLIESGDKKIIVDPGTNKKLLLEKLNENDLTVGDIDYIFLTHYHPDHSFLAAIFSNATMFDGDTSYKEDIEGSFSESLPDTDVKVIFTPGHAHEHTSLLVPTEKGKVIVSGDVFWWTDDEEQKTDEESLLSHKDPYVKNEKDLLESRKKLLAIADFIIPGHGKMFEIEK